LLTIYASHAIGIFTQEDVVVCRLSWLKSACLGGLEASPITDATPNLV